MANTSVIYARVDTNLKENAESILKKLGVSPSSVIQMLYSQIVINRGIPFEIRLDPSVPTAIGGMNREQLDAELQKGIESAQSGAVYSEEDVDQILKKEFGI